MVWNCTMGSMAGFMWTTWKPSREELHTISLQASLLLSVVARGPPVFAGAFRTGASHSLCPYFPQIKGRCRSCAEGNPGLRGSKTSDRRRLCCDGGAAAGPLRARLLPVLDRSCSQQHG